MLSEVVTRNCVRNPGGHAESTRDLPNKGSAFTTSSNHRTKWWADTIPTTSCSCLRVSCGAGSVASNGAAGAAAGCAACKLARTRGSRASTALLFGSACDARCLSVSEADNLTVDDQSVQPAAACRVGAGAAARGALVVFPPPTVLQWRPICHLARSRRRYRTQAEAVAVHKHRTCERAMPLHRLQDIRSRTCTLCIRARFEDLVAYPCVGLRPPLPSVWRHTLRHAKPLWCWLLSPACTTDAAARSPRRPGGTAGCERLLLPSHPFPFFFPCPHNPRALGLLRLPFAPCKPALPRELTPTCAVARACGWWDLSLVVPATAAGS